MKLDVKNPLPFYRKLLLENKILLFFTFLVLILGAITLFTTHWAVTWYISEMLADRTAKAIEPWKSELAVAKTGPSKISPILKQIVQRDPFLAYAVLTDQNDRIIGYAGDIPPLKTFLEPDPNENPHTDNAVTITHEGNDIGKLHLGFAGKYARGYATKAVMAVASLMMLPVLLLLVASRMVVRRAVMPLKQLTRVADEISTGNLDPVIDFGIRVNCWETKNCQRTDCKAYQNFKQQCWYIDGTPCEGYEPRFPQKLAGCRTCEVYQLHRGDEIVQLADAIKHMTNTLVESRENLVKSGDYQQRLIRNSFDGIVATDDREVITIFNTVAEELSGYDRKNVIGQKSWREFFKEGLEKIMDIPMTHEKERRLRGFPPHESQVRRADGTWADVRLAGISMYDKGIHLGRVFFFQDMREIKRLRDDLIRNERMAATGQAAAGISHSIRNILDGFRGGVFIFKQGQRKNDEKKIEMGWDMIERNTEIISDLVKDLLNFSKDRVPEYEECEPAELLESVLESAGLNSNNGVLARVELDEPGRKVMIDRHSFHQCLTNLARNAAEAIPYDQKGEIVLGTKFKDGKILFYVKDNGEGMSAETIEKIKGGMFSTKGSKGTGLGLQVAQKIINEHQGTLEIESELNAGTTFLITIPTETTVEN